MWIILFIFMKSVLIFTHCAGMFFPSLGGFLILMLLDNPSRDRAIALRWLGWLALVAGLSYTFNPNDWFTCETWGWIGVVDDLVAGYLGIFGGMVASDAGTYLKNLKP